ncbi:TPA: hypothetical protein N0F65_009480 [Lagenidium giganteum]|uniref:Uncharacterized protein n=1 Tax=Lagenidium giganteum TaxID=4803 RepID=A0AAV2ZE80_9STRA|nr:TPA: hypothetical protein N0F65_009480 [Lagenidium giganteum]
MGGHRTNHERYHKGQRHRPGTRFGPRCV